MSLRALAWAFDQRVGSSSLKLVLLKLADNFNDETGICFPSIGYISERTELNQKTVRSALKTLEEKKLISIEQRKVDGKQMSNVYRINLPLPNSVPLGYQKREGGVPKTGGGGVPKTVPESSSEPEMKQKITPASAKKPSTNPNIKVFIDWFFNEYQKRMRDKVRITGRDAKLVQSLLNNFPLDELKRRATNMLTCDDWYINKSGRDIGTLSSQWNKPALRGEDRRVETWGEEPTRNGLFG